MNETMLLAADAATPFTPEETISTPSEGTATCSDVPSIQSDARRTTLLSSVLDLEGVKNTGNSAEPNETHKPSKLDELIESSVLCESNGPDEPTDMYCEDIKTCPVCHAHVFADMDTCYNCMYLFGSNQTLEDRMRKKLPLGQSDPDIASAEHDLAAYQTNNERDSALFIEFLEEFRGFLAQFLADRGVHAQ